MQVQEIKEYRSMLLAKREQLIESLGKINNEKIRGNPISADIDDQSQELENDQVMDALDLLDVKELEKVDQALRRMEKGSYGICLDCGVQISSSRLKALPFAQQCIDCAH
jgi:DnaK suppressor protein